MDYCFNVGILLVVAVNFFEENHWIMKKWDFIVMSYNSGTKHFVKFCWEFVFMEDIDLEDIICHSFLMSFGFVFKNFYAEFLVFVYVIVYEDEFFLCIYWVERLDLDKDLVFFVIKCLM